MIEKDCYRIETAMDCGFKSISDDGDVFQCAAEQVVELMRRAEDAGRECCRHERDREVLILKSVLRVCETRLAEHAEKLLAEGTMAGTTDGWRIASFVQLTSAVLNESK